MITKLIEQSERYDESKVDIGPAAAMQYGFTAGTQTNSELGLQPKWKQTEPYGLTDWALGQVCQKLGPCAFPSTQKSLPKDYIQACPPESAAEQLNHWVSKTKVDREWFVRTYESRVRAVLSDRYAAIGVTDTLKWIQSGLDAHLGSEPVEFSGCEVTPDLAHIRVIFRNVNTRDGNYGIGGYFTTSEIGSRRLGAYPLIKRTSCNNSISVAATGQSFERRHVGHVTILKQMFIMAIYDVLKGSVELLERMLAAQETHIPKFTDYLDKLVADAGWNVETRDRILLGTEGHETLFGLVNGISAASQQVVDVTQRADMELFSGNLLFGKKTVVMTQEE